MTGTPSGQSAGSVSRSGGATARSETGGRIGTVELTEWLEERVPSLRDLWVQELRGRGLGRDARLEVVVEMFADQIVRLLPGLLGPSRDQLQPLGDRVAELFGAVAAKRGLAAGEAIEEIHALRELVIRDLYRDPPLGGTMPLSLREVLRLNRALDRTVTFTSIGHTDALFFEFFEPDVTSAVLRGEDVAAEAEEQLVSIRAEVREVLEHAAGALARAGRAN